MDFSKTYILNLAICEIGRSEMKITIKNGKLYDVHARKFVEAFVDWIGHGDHDKKELPTTRKVKFIPYRCECGAILSDLHESSLFRD